MTRPMANDPPWLQEAWQHLGQKEITGPASNSWIENLWLARPGGRWFWEHYGRDDSKLPWCGAFTAHCFATKGMVFPKHYQRASAWEEWGTNLDRPTHGCVVVFGRAGGGHVGFVVGETPKGDLLVLGGNQNDSVRVSTFRRGSNVKAYRWPIGWPAPAFYQLMMGEAPVSTSEA